MFTYVRTYYKWCYTTGEWLRANVDYNSVPIITSKDVYGEEISVPILTKDQVDSYFEQLLRIPPQSIDDEWVLYMKQFFTFVYDKEMYF